MDDATIYRSAAIGEVAKALKGIFVEYEDVAEKIINKVPPAQPEPKPYRMGYQAGYAAAKRWIPCSERLPEKYGEYRITWTTSASEKRFVADCEYEVYSEWDAVRGGFKGQWLLEDYIKAYPDVHVIAWKPLEEPYRPEGDDKE